MPNPDVTVSVVVLNYNGEALLADCLDSLSRQDFSGYEVIVVDNHSQDRSVALVRSRYPRVRLLALDENQGFCAGNHAGVAAAAGRYVALVNNDTVLPPRFLRDLASALDAHPEAWIAMPRIDNRNLDMRAFPGNGTLGLNGLIIQNVFRDPATVFGAPGAALMFRRQEVGLPFDPDYQFFHEDVYLSWRTWLTGHTIVACPQVVVSHVGSASFRREKAWYVWLMERNRLMNLFTFYSRSTLLRLLPLLLGSLGLELAYDLFAGRALAPRFQAYGWLLGHLADLRAKRRKLQAERRVPDRVILQRMSCRMTNLSNLLGRTLNAGAWLWCWFMGLRTAEFAAGYRRADA